MTRDPYTTPRAPIDTAGGSVNITRDLQIEYARWTAGVTKARRASEYVIDAACPNCTPTATCGDCQRSRLLAFTAQIVATATRVLIDSAARAIERSEPDA